MAQSAPGWFDGCEHYKRNCKIIAPCCKKVFSCRFCHDDTIKNHVINRFEIKEVVCNSCAKIQPVGKFCMNCKASFGIYVCLICKLFDNEERGQFHCEKCGICRVGGKQNYFHCIKCNTCLAWRIIDNHTCVENVSHANCPICLEDMHTSRKELHVPVCGHLLHMICFDKIKKEHTLCILCQRPYST